ncbi:MAG: phenylalanine--tRNA ligase subunit beta [Candidatus Paceibacterota bacterium]|jgi:phenylalanyl-tRNA synthetase beta chain
MKVSRTWLQRYFDTPLPATEAIAEALTFHVAEVEEAEGDLLDVKVLPDRAGYMLCHRGIAKELSAILNIPLKDDPLNTPFPMWDIGSPTLLQVEIEEPKKCLRYRGALVKGVNVGPSPEWLREALEAVGQRSINNIVDATNYVMLNIGQPLHAFDAAKLMKNPSADRGKYTIKVRNAREGEKITTLSGDEYALPESVLLITDANADSAIGIAGVKGGKAAELTEATTDIIVEAANFDGTAIRRAAQALKLVTDASLRFQNRPSPELAGYGMRDVISLIREVAGGEVAGVVDTYPARSGSEQERKVSVSLEKINGVLGSDFSKEEVIDVFNRLGLPYSESNETFEVTPPFERTDLVIPEDLVEEVGRILGYDRLPATELPCRDVVRPDMVDQAKWRGIEKVKDFLVERGFVEISTQSFAAKGDITLANPLDKAKPALRTSLDENMKEALERAKYVAPLVLAPGEKPKLFEIGTVFPKEGERLEIKTSEPVPGLPAIEDDASYEPKRYQLGAFKPFSLYPFITRDIAFWASADVDDGFTKSIVQENAGELLVRLDQFDRFEKEGKVSLAYRLVFQSMERTLTDDEVNGIMAQITTALTAKGYEVR